MAVTKSSLLASLRKSTGYSVANCKKALEMFPGSIEKAEEWLHAEAKSKGWDKWAKAQSRTATQGIVGVCTQNNVGVMVEINCETDFVSRNLEFQEYVVKMLSGCMNVASKLNVQSDVAKEIIEGSQLSAVKCETSSLGELLVAVTSRFNEKTVAKRALCLKVKEEITLNGLSHPTALCPNLEGASLGKYGVLLATKKTKIDENVEDTSSIGLNICQHIIGMNPLSVGQLTEKEIAKFTTKEKSPLSELTADESEPMKNEESPESEKNEEVDDTYVEGQETIETQLKESNETRLMFQSYLLDPTVTVGETLYKSGIEVVEFERFECGESTEDEPKIAQSAVA